MNSTVYHKMLKHHFVPALENRHPAGLNAVIVQDGAKPHTSNETKKALDNMGLVVVNGWPPYSPDLNPIENLWAILKTQVCDSDAGEHMARNTKNTEWIRSKVFEYFHQIPEQTITKLVMSWERRLYDCVAAGGAKLEQ